MKWFKHHTNLRSDVITVRVRRTLGHKGQLAWYLLLEVIAEQYENGNCSLEMHRSDWLVQLGLARNAGLTLSKLFDLLQDLDQITFKSNRGFITVTLPMMNQLGDEYTNKVRRKSEQNPERTENIKLKKKISAEAQLFYENLADRIFEAIRKFGTQRYIEATHFCGHGAKDVIKACGGWNKLCNSDPKNAHFIRLNLIKTAEFLSVFDSLPPSQGSLS